MLNTLALDAIDHSTLLYKLQMLLCPGFDPTSDLECVCESNVYSDTSVLKYGALVRVCLGRSPFCVVYIPSV